MKQLLLICFSVMAFGLSAQELISMTPQELVFEEEFCDELKTLITLKNETSEDLELLWYLDRSSVPDTWSFQICDTKLCYNYGIETCPTSQVNTLLAIDTLHPYELKAKSTEVGTGLVYLVLHNPNDVNDIYRTIEYDLTFSECILSVEEDLTRSQVIISPNPISDNFSIVTDHHYDRVIVRDINGKIVKQLSATQDYVIGDLQQGVYIVQLLAADNKIGQTIRIYKD